MTKNTITPSAQAEVARNWQITLVADGGYKLSDIIPAYGSYSVIREGRVVVNNKTGFPTMLTANQAEIGIIGWALRDLADKIVTAGKAVPADVSVVVKTDSQLAQGYFRKEKPFVRKQPELVRLAARADEIIAQFKSVEFVKVDGAWVKRRLGH